MFVSKLFAKEITLSLRKVELIFVLLVTTLKYGIITANTINKIKNVGYVNCDSL